MKWIPLAMALALTIGYIPPAQGENRPVDTEDIDTNPAFEDWIEPSEPLAWVSSLEQPIIGERIQLSSRAPEGAGRFLQQLSQVLTNETVEVYFGLSESPGYLQLPDGRSIAEIFFVSRKCSTRCRPNTPGELNRIDLTPWMPGKKARSITSSSGICGELSVVHGLVDRTVVDPTWKGVTKGKNWDDGFVNRVWKKAGSSTSGTSISAQKSAFKADWNSVWHNQCYRSKRPTKAGFLGLGGMSVKAWCADLQDHVQTRKDPCIFGLNGGGAKRTSGHAMYTVDARWTGSKCVVRVVDTGVQGAPTGKNVPRRPGLQIWEVSGTASKQVIRNTEGASQGFWNRQRYRSVDSVCCDEEKKWFPNQPERKGTAWK